MMTSAHPCKPKSGTFAVNCQHQVTEIIKDMSLGKKIKVSIALDFSVEHGGLREQASITTNDVPVSLIIESLQNLVRGLAQTLIEEASEEVPAEGYERYLDGRIKADRDILMELLKP